METLKYCKVRKVKSPVRAHASDAGIDFYIPEDIQHDTFLAKCDVTKCYPAATFTEGILKSIVLAPGQSLARSIFIQVLVLLMRTMKVNVI